jgi:hypothetical protein
MLEERRVFHAGAMVAGPVAGSSAPAPLPPPPTTTVTLDASQNLVVKDTSSTGQNDQLSVRLDAAHGRFVISDAKNLLQTDIAGATGNGTHQIAVPLSAVTGERVIVDTGAGNDSLAVDLTDGLGGKTLVFDGGEGQQDALTLVGGSVQSVGYLIEGDGSAAVQIASPGSTSLIELHNVEPVFDQLAAQSRQFTLGSGIGATLGDDGVSGNHQSQLTTTLGTTFTFDVPTASLTLQGAGTALTLHGLDATFAGDLRLDGGASGSIDLTGELDLHGGDLWASAGTIDVSGTIATQHANIDLRAQSTLTVTASGTINDLGGRVVLDAGAEGTLQFSGQIDVSDTNPGQRGGDVQLLGREVKVLDRAVIDASGWSGGGSVLVGGDYQGQNPAVRRATNTLVSAEASIKANALADGNGGRIIVWADETAIVAGSGNLQARGGQAGGDGGMIETSGKRYLEVGAAPDASAPHGTAGTWLLDPFDVTIQSSGGTGSLSSGGFTSSLNDTTINASVIQSALNAGVNVTINAGTVGGPADGGTIFVDAPIAVTASGSDVKLTLNAASGIEVNAKISSTGRDLNVVLNANGGVTFTAPIVTDGSLTVDADDGDIVLSSTETIVAGSVSFTASLGVIRTTVGGTHLDTSANDGDIDLDAHSIGSATDPIRLNPDEGHLSLRATAGGVFVAVAGSIDTSHIDELNVQEVGADIQLTAENGSITLDDQGGFDDNTHDDKFTLRATGSQIGTGSIFFSSTSLEAGAATLQADRFITRIGGSGAEINTLAHNGDVTLIAPQGIGSNANPLRVSAGAGVVTATTTTGSIWLRSEDNLRLGLVTTGSGSQTVMLDIAGDLEITASSNTDDSWQVNAGQDIQFLGNAGITAAVFSQFRAGDQIISGTGAFDIAQTAVATNVKLEAGSIGTPTNAVIVSLDDAGKLDLTAHSGDLCVFIADGDLTDSRFVFQNNHYIDVPASDVTICLGTMNGSIAIDNLLFVKTYPNDALRLEAHTKSAASNPGNIDLGANTLGGKSVTLIADGQILYGGFSVAIDTSPNDGNITLQSGGPIGLLSPLLIEAGDGLVSARTTGPVGTISLQSNGDMSLGSIVGTSVILSSTTGSILRGDDNVDIDTSAVGGVISLAAAISLGAGDEPLVINPGATGVLLLQANTGDVHLAISQGDFQTSRINALILPVAGTTLDLDVRGGSLIVDSFGVVTALNRVELAASNDIVFSGTPLIALSADLTAGDSIIGAGASTPDIVTLGGSMALTAVNGIGSPGTALSVLTDPASFVSATTTAVPTTTAPDDGSIYLTSPFLLRLASVRTEDGQQKVSITSSGGIEIVDFSDTDDAWHLGSGGPLHFTGSGEVKANSFVATIGPEIASTTGGVIIDTSAANGLIYLQGAILGDPANELILRPGAGELQFRADSGGMWVAIDGGDLHTAQITVLAAPQGAPVSLRTVDGDILVDALVGLTGSNNKLLTLTAGGSGDIDFQGDATRGALEAAELSLTAGGSILSTGTAALDIDTSQFDGAVSLEAHQDIGSSTAPLVVQANMGVVSATADLGGIFIESPGALVVGSASAGGAEQHVSFATTGDFSPLDVTVASLDDDHWHLISTGDISLKVDSPDGIRFSQIEDLHSRSRSQNLLIEATNGPITIDDLNTGDADSFGSGIITNDDQLTLIAQGDIQSATGQVLNVGELALESKTGSIGDARTPFTFASPILSTKSAGSQWLVSSGTTRLTSAKTIDANGIISGDITLLGGEFLLDSPSSAPPTDAAVVTQQFLVSTGVHLGGEGSVLVTDNFEVQSGGIVDMGFAEGAAGRLQVYGEMFFDLGSTLIIDINAPYTTAGKDYDQIALTGNLNLQQSTLSLRGAQELRVTINPVVLIDLQSPGARQIGTGFRLDGTTVFKQGQFTRVQVNQFRGNLIFNGGVDHNDVVIDELSFVPPILRIGLQLPVIKIPMFTRTDQLPPPVTVLQPITPPTIPPPIERESEAPKAREIEIRIVVPIDDMGNVQEQEVMKLPADWLQQLPNVLRRLPDDHYRVYLVLEGGSEERLVIDVFVRGGRAVEPGEAQSELPMNIEALPHQEAQQGDAKPASQSPPAPPRGDQTSALPSLPERAFAESAVTGSGGSNGRIYVGAAAATAAIVASRSPNRWESRVDEAASAIGHMSSENSWRWWRRGRVRSDLRNAT